MSPASIGPCECGKARPVISRSPRLNVTWVALVLLLTFLSAACSLSGGPFGPNLISKSGQESNGPITLSTNLPPATVGTPYNSILTIRGGSAPYKLSVTGGKLPRGFTLDSSTGSLSGMPHSTGKFGFTVLVTDADDDHGETTLNLNVEPPNGSPPPPPPPPPPSDGADNRYCDAGDVPNFGSSDGP